MIIDKFLIKEQAKEGCDYVATEHVIDKKYELKVGDFIYYASYEGRGCSAAYNFKILAITEGGITAEEDGGRKKFIAWKDGERKLRIYPFPSFRNGLNKKNFHNRTNTLADFALYEHHDRSRRVHWNDDWYYKYINNFKNIVNEDAGVQQQINLRMDCCV